MSNCSNKFPESGVLYEELKSDIAVLVLTGLSAVLTVANIAVFVEEVWFFIKNYKSAVNKHRFIQLTALFPVISSTCMLGLLVPRSTMLVELVNAVYLSFCIMIFVQMIIAYFGRTEDFMKEFAGTKITFRTPPCCCCCICFNDFDFNKKTFKMVKVMSLQVAIIRPIVLFIAAVLWTDDKYELGEKMSFDRGYIYIQIISGISTLFAIWGLIITFRNTAEKLKHHRLRVKFVSLQLAIIFINLQQFIFSILARYNIPECSGTRSSVVRGYRSHYFLLTLEMFLLTILARFAYRRKEEEQFMYTENNKEVEMEGN